jgi:hypothetical protein
MVTRLILLRERYISSTLFCKLLIAIFNLYCFFKVTLFQQQVIGCVAV